METKKLTCCDLMVGDLVCYCKENNYLTKVESIHNTGHASVSYEYCIKCFRDRKDPLYDKNPIDFFNVEILHPIPITAAILEKNGWYIPTNSSWWHNNEIDFYLVGYTDGSFQIYTDEDSEFSNLCRINHVHELQNLYRICRISKEIVL